MRQLINRVPNSTLYSIKLREKRIKKVPGFFKDQNDIIAEFFFLIQILSSQYFENQISSNISYFLNSKFIFNLSLNRKLLR